MKNVIIDKLLYKVHDNIFKAMKMCYKNYMDYRDSDFSENTPPKVLQDYNSFIQLVDVVKKKYKATFIETIFAT